MARKDGQKSRAQLIAELDAQRRFNLAQPIAAALATLFRWAGGVLIAFFVYKTAAVLAGQNTQASIVFKALTDAHVSDGLLFMFGAGGTSLAIRERRLRHRSIERLEKRPRELEKKIDPKRTSSRLTPRGETPPEERQP